MFGCAGSCCCSRAFSGCGGSFCRPCRPQILMGRFSQIYWNFGGFPDAAVVKNPSANSGDAGDLGWILESGRSPGEGNGNPLPYSCLENSKNRGAWQATVHGVAKSQT